MKCDVFFKQKNTSSGLRHLRCQISNRHMCSISSAVQVFRTDHGGADGGKFR